MGDVGIEVAGVWKKFHRGEIHDSLRDLVPAAIGTLFGRGPRRDELAEGDFWALRDVGFAVPRGRALGIVGPNGAGKSTMLKLLTRILRPTRGYCEVHGRVGALIEIAAGFHPDLTGRENVLLQGVIMGMTRADVMRKLDEIVEFAGVGAFIDTPVKRYSSGMNARLGFSVAAHLDPDVLLIDEVLAVGDVAFQEKCVRRMRDFKRDGAAIVFVSHNMQAIASLCDEAVFLSRSVLAAGPVHDIIAAYLSESRKSLDSRSGGLVEILDVGLTDEQGRSVKEVRPGERLKFHVSYRAREPVADVQFGFLVHRSTDGLIAYDGSFRGDELGLRTLPQGRDVEIEFTFLAHLTRGQYHVECHVFHNPTQDYLVRLSPAGTFTVNESRTFAGVADVELQCRLTCRGPAQSEVRAR